MARCRWQGVVPHVASFSRWNLRQIGIGHEFQRAVLANECGGEIVKSHASPTKGARGTFWSTGHAQPCSAA